MTYSEMQSDTAWQRRFLRLAREIASWSKDPRTKVGAVIVDYLRRPVSYGYNGFPRDMEDKATWLENPEEKYSRIIHAEINAVLNAQGPIPRHSVLYTWPLPCCDRCVVQMLQAGITTFVAPEPSAEHSQRWGTSIERSTSYIKDCNAKLYLFRGDLDA